MLSGHLRRLTCSAPLVALLAAGGLTACDDFLAADNPGAIQEPSLTDPRYAGLIPNGVVGEFQFMHGNVAYWNGVFTDELHNRAVFFEEGLIDRRDIQPENGTWSTFLYNNLHRTRFLADDGARRLKIILGDTAARDIRLARTLAYGALAYVYLAEMVCESPIDMSAPLSPDTLFRRALVRFDEAIAVATAAKAHALAQTPPANAAGTAADSIRFFALVGAARAALNLNDKARAVAYATQVPALPVAWDFRAYYSSNSTRENNWMHNRIGSTTGGGNNATMLNTPFDTIGRTRIVRPGLPDSLAPYDVTKGDPRIPRRGGTLAATNPIPHSPPSYSSYTGTVAGATFVQGGYVRIASNLEARYIIAEAEGPTSATNTFVNERRAVGLRPAVTLTGDSLMAELRVQRSRDFYLDNHRLGDLRRYKKYYGIDLFQKGAYPGSTTGERFSDDVSCWTLPLSEINDNPNVPKPYTRPNVP